MSELQIREGVRYVRRDGKATPAAVPRCGIFYQWLVGEYTYTDEGRFYRPEDGDEHDFDLVAEYIENTTDIGRADWGPHDDWNQAVDPGEGYRIYDVATEGDEPREDAEYYWNEQWHKVPKLCETLDAKYPHRVPVPPPVDPESELRKQCRRQAERIEEMEKALDTAKAGLEWVRKDLSDGINYQAQKLEEVTAERDELKNWRQKIGEALDRIEPGWLDRLNDSAVLCAVRKIEEMDDLILTKDRLIKAHREVLDDVEKECDALKAELASRPAALRWERRKPTEQECRERFYLTRIIGDKWPQFLEPDETNADNWRDDVETCVLPDILPAEPPKTVTLRRWLVCEDDDWLDVWIDEGAEPQGEWDEMIKTDKTQEVPE